MILPVPCENSRPSWFGFLITCKEGVDRNRVVPYIESHGVQTRMLFAEILQNIHVLTRCGKLVRDIVL